MLSRRASGQGLIVLVDDVDRFEGLRRELDAERPAGWRETPARRLPEALKEPGADAVLIGVGPEDADGEALEAKAALASAAHGAGRPVVLVVRDLPAAAVHRLMRAGADDFLPAPLPEGGLAESLTRLRRADAAARGAAGPSRDGRVHAVHGVAGGVGATTFAVNLAWEIATEGRRDDVRACLVDLDLQYGATSTYLDLPRRESVLELLGDLDRADAQGFAAALSDKGRLSVLTAPLDAAPLDIVTPADVERLLTLARETHDVVIVDLPRALTLWTETVLHAAERFHAVMEIDMRSAQNMLRFLRLLKSEDLPLEKIAPILNRAPGRLDYAGRGRVKRMEESLGIEFAVSLPDGGRSVTQAGDHGSPLAEFDGSNALRKRIRNIARDMVAESKAVRARSA